MFIQNLSAKRLIDFRERERDFLPYDRRYERYSMKDIWVFFCSFATSRWAHCVNSDASAEPPTGFQYGIIYNVVVRDR